ncbi:MAG: ion transporter [Nonlabens sp.]|nr:ion transporter [Nonlabens sp.]MDP5101413.1 ion transporter [Nonlabens sp.]
MDKNNTQNMMGWRAKIHQVIYEADTPAGKLFDLVLLFIILVSIALVMLESVPSIGQKYGSLFLTLEWIVTIFFTIEYILRIVSIKHPWKYIFSFYGIIDLLSTLPLYLGLFIGGFNALLSIRSLRLLRVFRILKITQFIGESDKLKRALKASAPKIAVFLFAVLVISIIFGTLMYIIEGPESGFVSIPVAIYWCIVTLTTVGFGDIAPVTPLGQFIASLIMIMGYGIIAVPTGIVSSELTVTPGSKPSKANQQPSPIDHTGNTQVCRNCLAERHLNDAIYCHECGFHLHD